MKHFIFIDENQDVTGLGEAPDLSIYEGQQILEIEQSLYASLRKTKTGAYLVNGIITVRPRMPSMHHRWNVITKQWDLDEATQYAEETKNARAIRSQLLTETDWTDTLSAQNRFGSDLYNQWQTYRQALRDIPEQAGFPLSIIWPTPPA
jgi:hypothetical protein